MYLNYLGYLNYLPSRKPSKAVRKFLKASENMGVMSALFSIVQWPGSDKDRHRRGH